MDSLKEKSSVLPDIQKKDLKLPLPIRETTARLNNSRKSSLENKQTIDSSPIKRETSTQKSNGNEYDFKDNQHSMMKPKMK
mmetsp:Transcript_30225/g.29721  ORF Transcript_30225/g.29721 Transcript_30225/m.29721 type:complete len:81 (-) Transcript_30225:1184-1426(-)